jgi:hypothetical protein
MEVNEDTMDTMFTLKIQMRNPYLMFFIINLNHFRLECKIQVH